MAIAQQVTPIVLTVSQLTHAIKLQLEQSFPLIWLKGEVSNLKIQSSGHVYFSLKDENAQIAAVMFRMDAQRLAMPIKVGDQVIAKGEINVYPPKGNYQLIVRELSLVGIGELLMRVQLLKQKLESLGWFSSERKKPLPSFPRKIGVVTSPTGAVIQDIINILTRRYYGFHLILNPVKVQGDGAAEEIAQAIEQFNTLNLVDVIIVGRGGGSFEDLMPFNDEKVAAAIFHSQTPIISAVGHETDTCIADWVADVRAPTPSAAAEMVIQEKSQILETLLKWQKQMYTLTLLQIRHRQEHLLKLQKHPVLTSSTVLLANRMQRLDDIKEGVDLSAKRYIEDKLRQLTVWKRSFEQLRPSNQIIEKQKRLDQFNRAIFNASFQLIRLKKDKLQDFTTRLNQTIKRIIEHKREHIKQSRFETRVEQSLKLAVSTRRERLGFIKEHIDAVNPKNLLKKGYSILFSEKTQSVITSVQSVAYNDKVSIQLADGTLKATIYDKENYEQ